MTQQVAPISMITASKFIQLLAGLFDVGTHRDRKITNARSYSAMQDRYAQLAGEGDQIGDLVSAIVGQPLFLSDTDTRQVEADVRRYLGNIQQLVSWFQVIILVKGTSQMHLNRTLLKLFAVPQVTLVICELRAQLPSYSPLKEFEALLTSLENHQFDPIASCKTLLRATLKKALYGVNAPPNLAFYQALKSLDKRSSKSNAAIKADLITLNKDLSFVLPRAAERENLIHHLYGLYLGIMVIDRFKHLLEKSETFWFQSFSENLNIAIKSCEFDSKKTITYRGVNRTIHCSNADILADIYDEADFTLNIARIFSSDDDYHPCRNEHFIRLLKRSNTYCNFGIQLSVFFASKFEDIKTLYTHIDQLSIQIEHSKELPFYDGIKAYLKGFIHLKSDDLSNAEVEFKQVLEISSRTPLGIIRRRAAAMCIGFKIKSSRSLPPKILNPLLMKFIESSHQKYETFIGIGEISDYSRSVENYNLQLAIKEYNRICECFMSEPTIAVIERHIVYGGTTPT